MEHLRGRLNGYVYNRFSPLTCWRHLVPAEARTLLAVAYQMYSITIPYNYKSAYFLTSSNEHVLLAQDCISLLPTPNSAGFSFGKIIFKMQIFTSIKRLKKWSV